LEYTDKQWGLYFKKLATFGILLGHSAAGMSDPFWTSETLVIQPAPTANGARNSKDFTRSGNL